MTKEEIASHLKQIGQLLELHDENPFRARAFQRAARSVKQIEDPKLQAKLEDTDEVKNSITEKDLTAISGIGKGLAGEILELIKDGESVTLKKLLEKTPSGLLEILELPGIGPKKVGDLYRQLGIKSLGELEYACRENRLVSLKGYGKKTQDKILKHIAFANQNRGSLRIDEAEEEAQDILERLEKAVSCPWKVSGQVRRFMPTVNSFHFLFSDCDKKSSKAWVESITQALSGYKWSKPKRVFSFAEEILGTQKGKAPIKIWKVNANAFGTAELISTGPKPFLEAFFEAFEKKWQKIQSNSKALHEFSFQNEEDFFKAVGLSSIPPECRDHQACFQWAKEDRFEKLLKVQDLRGVFHVHSTFSDGMATLSELKDYADKMNWEYLGLSDHSQSAFYANGLGVDRIEEQAKALRSLKQKGAVILRGIESDILRHGDLDYDQKTLTEMDFVIGSIHGSFQLSKKEQTERLLVCLDHPKLTMLGHLTGRLLLAREGYTLDMKKIMQKAAEKGVIIELNSSPHRLDLDWQWIRYFIEKGGMISINPDAHRLEDFENIRFGVMMARKAGVVAEEVFNTKPLDEIRKFLGNSSSGRKKSSA
jgi:DNA polymerase (family 10)